MSTYDGYAKEYYHKNKDRIREKTKAYRKKYNKKYYKLNKHKILQKMLERRLAAKAIQLSPSEVIDSTNLSEST